MTTGPLDQSWPTSELESVNACPCCQSGSRTVAFRGVQDWSFHCAPGAWTYWDCSGCRSLCLSPRPTAALIGAAYARCYTHVDGQSSSWRQRLKTRVRNECFSQTLKADILPRLVLPALLGGVVGRIGRPIVLPFGAVELASQPGGWFLDVGCGSGHMVKLAGQLGWDAMGLEMDPLAVKTTRQSGLNIQQGMSDQLVNHEGQLDAILCSHVLEHVHDPLAMLSQLKRTLRPGGLLLITLPNALSALRHHFGPDWRGLEAPRHLTIPSEPKLVMLLGTLGFSVTSQADSRLDTAPESFRIHRRGLMLDKTDIRLADPAGRQSAGDPVWQRFHQTGLPPARQRTMTEPRRVHCVRLRFPAWR